MTTFANMTYGDHLTADELSFLSSDAPDNQKGVNFTWRSEALFLLMWTTRLVDVLPLPLKGN